MKKRLFIMVEGEDDIRFFCRIINALLTPSYHSVEIIPYASIKREKVNKFLKSVVLMNNEYIFVADIDQERSVRDKKQILYHWFNDINGRNIVVVIREIESWYLAGLSFDAAQELGIADLSSTDLITKEDFNALIPLRFDSRIDFMFEILKSFSLETAMRKNNSFRFFINRYLAGKESLDKAVP
jgi:hypothetical protein